MKITLKLLVTFEKFLPPGSSKSQCEIEVPDGSKAADILALYKVPIEEAVILINGKTPSDSGSLQEGDVLCAFPVAAGGS